MKKYFTLAVLLLLAVATHCQTYVSGFISANTTWTVAGAPYIVTANALVSQGYTLTIQPGVVVKFDTHCALQIDGQLIAVGTSASRITFTSNQASPAAGDWDKLHFSGYCVGATFDANGYYLSGSIMKYADVLYAGGSGYGAVHIESSWPYISHCNVRLSSAAGIYCAGSTFILDSSLVADNTDYGLYFDDFSHFSCGLVINGDTIRNNVNGGLYLGSSSTTCSTMVSNSYFISNTTHGAIYDYQTRKNITITKNYFTGNSVSSSSYYSGIIAFRSGGSYIEITDNYFTDNTTDAGSNGIIYFVNGASYLNINNNSFIHNTCQYNDEGIIYFDYGASPYYVNINYNYFYNNSCQKSGSALIYNSGGNAAAKDTIMCNTFLSNHTYGNPGGVIFLGGSYYPYSAAIIINNMFDGNTVSLANGYCIFNMDLQSSDTLEFANNIIRNNNGLSGTGCYFNANAYNNNELLQIHNNEFYNNSDKFVIELDGVQTNSVNYDFLYMKHNNFDDVNYQIELYNHIPYGSPNVYADSNYWGSTSTAHIDSIISDYFDSTNYSVVYYLPFLIEPAGIDTTCSQGVITTVASVQRDADGSKPSPNPFSTYTKITVGKELNDASLLLYNVFGQKVLSSQHISGRQIRINRGNLPTGIYIYEITEKRERIGNGKLMVE